MKPKEKEELKLIREVFADMIIDYDKHKSMNITKARETLIKLDMIICKKQVGAEK